jgi:hypothetical protein
VAEPLVHRLNYEIDGERENSEIPDEAAHSRAVAEYLADMIGELESMARVAGLDLLVYLLSMAHIEAQTSARITRERRRL